MERFWCDWSVRKRILHVAPPFHSNALVACIGLSGVCYPMSLVSWFIVLGIVSCCDSVLSPPGSSSACCSSSIALCISASFVPSFGMNSRNRLALKDPGSWLPLRVFSTYELRSLETTQCGIDHLGRSLRSVLNV